VPERWPSAPFGKPQACGGVGARIDAQPYCGSEDLNFFGAHLPMWVADVRYFMTSANLPVLECFSAVVLMPSTRQERDAKESMVRSRLVRGRERRELSAMASFSSRSSATRRDFGRPKWRPKLVGSTS